MQGACGSDVITVKLDIPTNFFVHILQDAQDTNLIQEIAKMTAEFDALKAAVEDENTVIDSAVTLLTELTAAMVAAKDDPAAIQALADEVNAKKQALADSVTANTPATPTP